MTVHGIDISHWQEHTPSLTDLGFAFCRATYGNFRDDRYSHHAAKVRQAGRILGAYHFARNGSIVPVAAQAGAFLTVAAGADLLALDLERDGHNPRMTDNEAREMIDQVHRRGRRIGLYHSESGFPSLGQDFDWVANWSHEPVRHWDIWQSQGSPLDRDRFKGTAADLTALAGPVDAYRVAIDGRTPLFDSPGGQRVGAVLLATYIADRSRSNGLWWYRILTKANGTPTLNAGRFFKPNHNTVARAT